ncbi:MAG: hypothetical protein JJE30_13745 [Desulfuromonadales bacterium]|nr:hypothetical protein [Desulfuromonadales bacterium]
MIRVIRRPYVSEAKEGNQSMMIEEFVGRFSSETKSLSIARITSPAGRVESGRKPDFDEHVVVLMGCLRIESDGVVDEIHPGQAAIIPHGKRVCFSTPDDTEYFTVCLPAFAPRMVSWDR